eukprot:578178-Pyramimonas_sp.AAC.1
MANPRWRPTLFAWPLHPGRPRGPLLHSIMRVACLGNAPRLPVRRPAPLPGHGQGNCGRWGM